MEARDQIPHDILSLHHSILCFSFGFQPKLIINEINSLLSFMFELYGAALSLSLGIDAFLG